MFSPDYARALVTFVAILALNYEAGSASGEWPQWRGPKRDGISTETGLLDTWPAGGPPLLWKAKGLGKGYSSVAVGGGKIFTMGETTEASFIHALDLNGQPVWSSKLGQTGEYGGYFGPRATPTVDGDAVYVLGQHGDLVSVDADTGRDRWRKNLKKDFVGQGGGWGYTESPLVDGQNVICTPGGRQGAMVALHKKTGALVWRTADFKDPAEYSSAIVAEPAGVHQYIQFTGESVVGIGKAGELLWRAARRGSTATVPTPIYHDNHVYVTSGYGVGCNLFQLAKSGNKFTARQVYENNVMVNHHGGVILYNGHVYGYSDGKGWTCQDFTSGASVWTDKKLGKGSIAYADGHFYLRSESGKGTVALIEASPQGYKETGRFDQPDRSDENSWAHPVIAGGRLYLRDQDVLLCYDIKGK